MFEKQKKYSPEESKEANSESGSGFDLSLPNIDGLESVDLKSTDSSGIVGAIDKAIKEHKKIKSLFSANMFSSAKTKVEAKTDCGCFGD